MNYNIDYNNSILAMRIHSEKDSDYDIREPFKGTETELCTREHSED